MPMHDWTKVKAGVFHNFHYRWGASIMDRLNSGLLPPGYFAMAEQIVGSPEADVPTLRTEQPAPRSSGNGNLAAVATRPKTRFVIPFSSERDRYAKKARRIVVHHELGNVVAVVEVVSPGNKDRKSAVQAFVAKSVALLEQQISLLIIDPFPPGRHDPQGIHGLIGAEFTDEPFELPPEKPLTLVSYQVEPQRTAYVEPIAVGDPLPSMPLFLEGEGHVAVPLKDTYQEAWNVLPVEVRRLLA